MYLKNLYPLKFEPILQPKIWGGDLLHQYLNKDKKSENIGESWEISDVEDFQSIISNGSLKGKSLNALISEEKERILGRKNFELYGENFPLLIKFLDARVPLSIQVHPDDEWAKKLENGQGKTEMWYILHAEEDAEIYLGWKRNVSPDEVETALKNADIQDLMQKFNPKKGDVFYVPARSIHSIGKGVVLAEIQQTSDITYRMYDYGRLEHGKPRELHIDKGMKVMNFDFIPDLKISYNLIDNQFVELVNEQYFTTSLLRFNTRLNLTTEDNFHIYIGITGQTEFEVEGEITKLLAGETLLIPAAIKNYSIHSNNAEVLQIKVD